MGRGRFRAPASRRRFVVAESPRPGWKPARIVVSARAARSIAGLDEGDRMRVAEAVRELARDPMAGKRLRGRFERDRLRSYRVWPFRLIYVFGDGVVSIVDVGNRRDIYR